MPRLNLLSGEQQGSSERVSHPGPLQFEPAFSILPIEFWGFPSNIGTMLYRGGGGSKEQGASAGMEPCDCWLGSSCKALSHDNGGPEQHPGAGCA